LPTGQPGRITVTAATDNGFVRLQVTDDGIGTDAVSMSFGLKGTFERLRLYFGEQFSFEVESAPGRGTSVTMNIPTAT
jgi:two-component system sensor histidine kinase YesM